MGDLPSSSVIALAPQQAIALMRDTGPRPGRVLASVVMTPAALVKGRKISAA